MRNVDRCWEPKGNLRRKRRRDEVALCSVLYLSLRLETCLRLFGCLVVYDVVPCASAFSSGKIATGYSYLLCLSLSDAFAFFFPVMVDPFLVFYSLSLLVSFRPIGFFFGKCRVRM